MKWAYFVNYKNCDWRRKRGEMPSVRILDSFQTEKRVAFYFGET
jgi:hypothetical protein